MDVFQGKLSQRKTLYRPLTKEDLEGVKEIDVVVCVTLANLIYAYGLDEFNEIIDSKTVCESGYSLSDITYWVAGYATGREGTLDGNVLIRVNAAVEKF